MYTLLCMFMFLRIYIFILKLSRISDIIVESLIINVCRTKRHENINNNGENIREERKIKVEKYC